MTQHEFNFRVGGDTYDPLLDKDRLGTELRAVYSLMIDSEWRTLKEIQAQIGLGSEAGISARLRDLRKARFGRHTVNRRRRGDGKDGLFEYQFIPNQGTERVNDTAWLDFDEWHA